jgi:putative transposase
MACRSTNETVYTAKYYLIWWPKFRRRVLVGAVETRLVEIIEVTILPDHVHLLVDVAPVVPMSTFIGALKGRSGWLLRREFPHVRQLPSLRTPSWFLSTVGVAPLEAVRRSVENQKLVA